MSNAILQGTTRVVCRVRSRRQDRLAELAERAAAEYADAIGEGLPREELRRRLSRAAGRELRLHA